MLNAKKVEKCGKSIFMLHVFDLFAPFFFVTIPFALKFVSEELSRLSIPV